MRGPYEMGYERGRGDALLAHAVPDERALLYDATYYACIHMFGRILVKVISYALWEDGRG